MPHSHASCKPTGSNGHTVILKSRSMCSGWIGRVSNVCRQKVLVLDKQTLLSYASGFPAGRFVFGATALSRNLIATSCSQISVQRQRQQQNNSGAARPKNNREKEMFLLSNGGYSCCAIIHGLILWGGGSGGKKNRLNWRKTFFFTWTVSFSHYWDSNHKLKFCLTTSNSESTE